MYKFPGDEPHRIPRFVGRVDKAEQYDGNTPSVGSGDPREDSLYTPGRRGRKIDPELISWEIIDMGEMYKFPENEPPPNRR